MRESINNKNRSTKRIAAEVIINLLPIVAFFYTWITTADRKYNTLGYLIRILKSKDLGALFIRDFATKNPSHGVLNTLNTMNADTAMAVLGFIIILMTVAFIISIICLIITFFRTHGSST